MREAVIVSAARTPIGKAYRGAFNDLSAPSLAAVAIKSAVERAGIEPSEMDDCIFGVALQQGSQGMNFARQVAIAAGLPVNDHRPPMFIGSNGNSIGGGQGAAGLFEVL
jgi:acetyl-CoA C-acetyltransferase